MKKISAFLTASLLLLGCTTEDKELYSRQIDIVSIPAGAPIVIDGLKMGKTPIGVGVETTEDGYFVRRTSITAVPEGEKLNTQVVTFPAHNPNNSDKSWVPAKIIFNMDKAPGSEGSVVLEEESAF